MNFLKCTNDTKCIMLISITWKSSIVVLIKYALYCFFDM